MEVIVRDVKIRGEIEYIIDTGDKMASSTQLTLLMKATYNSLLTDPSITELNPKWADGIENLKIAVENFLNISSDL